MQLRHRQREFVSRVKAALAKHGNTLAVAPTGFGKSCSLSAVGAELGGRGLILQHRDELVDQNRKTFKRVAPSFETDIYTADRKRWSPGVTFAMVQTLAGEDNLASIPSLDWVIVDECFCAGTLIDGVPIESIKPGDLVSSFNHSARSVEKRRVVEIMRRSYSGDWYRISDNTGRNFVCTENHPVYVIGLGYMPVRYLQSHGHNAHFLTHEMPLLRECYSGEKEQQEPGLQVLQYEVHGRTQKESNAESSDSTNELQDVRNRGEAQEQKVSAGCHPEGMGVLLPVVLGQVKECRVVKNDVGDEQENVVNHINENDAKKSNAGFRKCGEDEEGNGRKDVPFEGWKRPANKATDGSSQSDRTFDGVSDSDERCDGISKSTQLLQGGSRRPVGEAFDRSGWEISSSEKMEVPRQEEGVRPGVSRMACVEVYKRAGGFRPEWVPSEDTVYNLHVEGNHNYFAEGILVHNCHHVAAETYRRIINKVRERNPKAKVFGVTATPQRGDRKAIIEVFDNVADVVQLTEVISAGDLVRPRVFVIDCGLRSELESIKRVSDFDQLEVEKIMDKEAVTSRVIEEWRRLAGDRKTVVFASTVNHAKHVCESFVAAGITADVISGDMAKGDRARVLADYEKGRIQVLLNVAVLTEGWDCQTVSCVILLRKCSYKGTMTQMIGRGLRKVDPQRHPGVIKSDCVIIDFGYSILNNGDLNTDVVLEPVKGKPMTKDCPECGMKVPAGVAACPVCEHIFDGVARRQQEAEQKGILENFTLTEVEILELSPYRWQDMFDGMVMMANAMSAWAVLVFYRERWHAVGRVGKEATVLLAVSPDKVAVMASADDYLREHGDKDASRKTKRWLTEPATPKQLACLGLEASLFVHKTKYLASCEMTWRFSERDIQRIVMRA